MSKINPEFNKKFLDNMLKIRYYKQSKLKEIKKELLTRRINYEQIINQDERTQDNKKLNDLDKKRWDRQIANPLINQKKIKDARVVVFGCGGIGSNVLIGLIYSGVHNFRIIDYDKIELSNLNRQALFVPKDVNENKIEKAKERLLNINPNINIKSYNMELDYPIESDLLEIKEKDYSRDFKKVDKLIKWGDYIVNAVDFQGAQYLINDLCIKNQKSYYWGGIDHFLGDVFSFYPKENTPCLRCIFGSSDFASKAPFLRYKTKNEFYKGVNLGSTALTLGSFISEFIIHDICGINNVIHGHYVIYDALNFEIFKIPIVIDMNCQCQNY